MIIINIDIVISKTDMIISNIHTVHVYDLTHGLMTDHFSIRQRSGGSN